MEELLKKAREMYPEGTVIISIQSNCKYKLNYRNKCNSDIYTHDGKNIKCKIEKHISPYLYYDGKWSEIVSTLTPIVNNNYSIF